MAKCKFTGKRPLSGHRVSHSHRKTKHWQKPNVQSKRVYDEETGTWVRLRLSTSALRNITKNGLRAEARDAGIKL
ncbi:MAG TPA: 50S ribosomal protein L28 [Deltaproteobacteria bacterium]|nr:50S ribosomal protein L28 [Deltaproteobacteria bacterium]HCP47550.1 50S ribosomal protein L28 [Deltaproteobacteria bacterium]